MHPFGHGTGLLPAHGQALLAHESSTCYPSARSNLLTISPVCTESPCYRRGANIWCYGIGRCARPRPSTFGMLLNQPSVRKRVTFNSQPQASFIARRCHVVRLRNCLKVRPHSWIILFTKRRYCTLGTRSQMG